MILKSIRENVGYTQVQVAERVGISERAYQKYEAGERIPRLDTAQRIAKALGKSVEELFPPELA